MKNITLIILQAVIVLTGILTLFVLIRFPQTEGRAANLDLFSIYTDPFILYGYASSIVFFVALYKGYTLLGYIRQNETYSSKSVKALVSIKICAILLFLLIVLAGLYIRIFHHQDDDPAGFLAACIMTGLICIVVAFVAARFERKLKNTIAQKGT